MEFTKESSALNNETGLIRSGKAMTIYTGRKLLTNTNAKDDSSKPQGPLGGITASPAPIRSS